MPRITPPARPSTRPRRGTLARRAFRRATPRSRRSRALHSSGPRDRLSEIVVDAPLAIAEVEAKLRGEASKRWAERLVLTMRAVENGRYYSV